MIFKPYNSETVARVFFNGYFWGSLFLGLVALYGFISGAGMLATLSGFIYLVLVSLLSRDKKFRRSSFAILFCLFTFLFLNIPAAFILVEGSDYIYGVGLLSIPFPQSDYQQSLPLGFLYLSVFWVAMWLGIISIKTKRLNINQKIFSSIKLMPILLIGVISIVFTWIANQGFANARLERVEQVTSLLSLIFLDHAYLVMAGMVLFFKLNEPKHIVNSRKIIMLITAIFIGFTTILFIAGSKASILVILTLLLFLPFSFFRENPHALVLFPTPKFLVLLALIVLPLFFIVLIRRDPSTTLAVISEVDASVVHEIFNQIFYRFSQGGIDRFLLIFQSFVINTFDPDITREFVNYLAKNTLNLLLPGTPFPESYAPSSQLFPQVIQYNMMHGDIERIGLILSLNTQPYTIFGVFIIIFGLAAPVLLYLFTVAFIFIYHRIDYIFFKITMLYFFYVALSSYGFEVVIGNSELLFVSILLMYFFIKILSQFHVLLPAKSNCLVCTKKSPDSLKRSIL